MKQLKIAFVLLVILCIFILNGCGGGGGSSQPAALSSAKEIVAYSLNGTPGTIDGSNITVSMPYGTTDLTNLVATFITTGASVSVGSSSQQSTATQNDFTHPVIYTVKAADNSTATYTVTVTVAQQRLVWSKQDLAIQGLGIGSDNNGNSYVVGELTSTPFSKSPKISFYIIKYNSLGDIIWRRDGTASGGTSSARAISTDSNGNSYIIGNGLPCQTSVGDFSCSIAKYDTYGTMQWSNQINANVTGISIDSKDNSYVTGYTTVSAPGQPKVGDIYYFVTKYDNLGNLQWTKQIGAGGGNTQGTGIATDSYGNSYVTGFTTVSISGQPKQGNTDYFIVKYDTLGNLQWTRQAGSSGGYTLGYGIGIDSDGNSYITGDTTVGISGQQKIGNIDYFIAKYDTLGNLQWTRQDGAAGGQTSGSAISADRNHNIYITGRTGVGLYPKTQQGNTDYFIRKFNSDGNVQWTEQVGTSGGFTSGLGITTDNNNNCYVTGNTNVGISGQPLVEYATNYFIAKYTTN
jgi:hypothetical protein